MLGYRSVIAAILWLALGWQTAIAEVERVNRANANDVFGSFGFHSSTDAARSSCTVKMVLKKGAFIDKVPQLQALGLLNKELTQTKINSMPNSLAMAFAVQITPVVIKNFMKHTRVQTNVTSRST